MLCTALCTAALLASVALAGNESAVVNSTDNLDTAASSVEQSGKDSATTQDAYNTPSVTLIRPTDPNKVQLHDKFNYASFDCGAVVISANREAKGVSSILTNAADSYMLNICSATLKYFAVELCEDILVQTVVLGNLEYFSNTFRDFYIDVASKYPNSPNGWHRVGLFRARNSRTAQVFQIDNPLIWARYIRFEQVSHYGNEYYCPINVFRVYGKTMMEDVKEDEEKLLADPHQDTQTPSSSGGQRAPSSEVGLVGLEDELGYYESLYSASQDPEYSDKEVIIDMSDAGVSESSADGPRPVNVPITPATPMLALFRRMFHRTLFTDESRASPFSRGSDTPLVDDESTSLVSTATEPLKANATVQANRASTAISVSATVTRAGSDLDAVSPVSQNASHNLPSPTITINSSPTSASVKQAYTTPHVPPPVTSQDSIFKTMLKRIAQLEKNFTVSYKYLEEQSTLLNKIFRNWDDVQRKRFSSLIASFNTSLINLDQHHQLAVQGLRAELNEIRRYLLHIPRGSGTGNSEHGNSVNLPGANLFDRFWNLLVGLVVLGVYVAWSHWNARNDVSNSRMPQVGFLNAAYYDHGRARSASGMEPLNSAASPIYVEHDTTNSNLSSAKSLEYQRSVLWAFENDESVLMSASNVATKLSRQVSSEPVLSTADFLPQAASISKKRSRPLSEALLTDTFDDNQQLIPSVTAQDENGRPVL